MTVNFPIPAPAPVDAMRPVTESKKALAAGAPLPALTPQLIQMLPGAMADLMRAFIDSKDVSSRVQIKFRMKALLDYAAADTEYPPNPLVQPEPALNLRPQAAAFIHGRCKTPAFRPGM